MLHKAGGQRGHRQKGNQKVAKRLLKSDQNEKKVTKKWPREHVSDLPPFAYLLLRHVDQGGLRLRKLAFRTVWRVWQFWRCWKAAAPCATCACPTTDRTIKQDQEVQFWRFQRLWQFRSWRLPPLKLNPLFRQLEKTLRNQKPEDPVVSQRAPNTLECAQPHLSGSKGCSSPESGYKFGCVCSYLSIYLSIYMVMRMLG